MNKRNLVTRGPCQLLMLQRMAGLAVLLLVAFVLFLTHFLSQRQMHQISSFPYQTCPLFNICEDNSLQPFYLASCGCYQLFETDPPFIHMLDTSLRSYAQKLFHTVYDLLARSAG